MSGRDNRTLLALKDEGSLKLFWEGILGREDIHGLTPGTGTDCLAI